MSASPTAIDVSQQPIEGRQQYLIDVVDNLLTARLEWVESDEERVRDDSELYRAAEETIEVFADGAIPSALRKMAHVVASDLAPAWKRFVDGRQVSNAPIDEVPGDHVWAAIDALTELRDDLRSTAMPQIETVEELRRQNVSDRQICVIYGWLDDSGAPELHKVREEIAEPGRHTKDWVHPLQRKRDEAQENNRRIRERIARRQRSKVQNLTAPCPEPIEDLILQGLSAKQIAKMRKCSIESVYAAADQLGLPRPPEDYSGVLAGSKQVAPVVDEEPRSVAHEFAGAIESDETDFDENESEESEASTNEFEAAAEIEREILSYLGKGLTNGQIAEAMTAAGKPVTWQKVRSVLMRQKQADGADGVDSE